MDVFKAFLVIVRDSTVSMTSPPCHTLTANMDKDMPLNRKNAKNFSPTDRFQCIFHSIIVKRLD